MTKFFILGPPPKGSCYTLRENQNELLAKYFPVKRPRMSRFVYGKYLDEKQNLAKDYNPKTDVIVLVYPVQGEEINIRAIPGESALIQTAEATNTPADHPVVSKWISIVRGIPSLLVNDDTDRTSYEILADLLKEIQETTTYK